MSEFEPLKPKDLGHFVDVPVSAETDWKKLYQDQVYITKKMAKMLYDMVEAVREPLKSNQKAIEAIDEVQKLAVVLIRS